MDVNAAEQDFRGTQQSGPSPSMETYIQKKSHVRKANFSEEELTWLVEVFENTWTIICDPSKTADTNRRKRMMWQKIAQDHAARFPDKPRTIDEMKNKLLKLKCEAKADWVKGKITLANMEPPTEDSEMTLMRYVHQKIIRLCEKHEPESLMSLQFPELPQTRSSPEDPNTTNGSNSGLPPNVKIEYVLDDESSGAQSEDPLPDQWEPTPVFQTSASSVTNGSLSSIPASSGQPASVPSTSSPRPTPGSRNGSSGPLLDQSRGYALAGGQRDDRVRELPPISSQYTTGLNDGNPHNDLGGPTSLSRQSSLVSTSSYVPETPVQNTVMSYQPGMDERWQQQQYVTPTSTGARDYPPPSLAPQFSTGPVGGGTEGSPNLPSQHQEPKAVISDSPDHEASMPLSTHPSYNGSHGTYGRTPSHPQLAPTPHLATPPTQRVDRNYAACNPSGAAAENGCSSPELDHSLSSMRKRMRLSPHQHALMDEILELERSTLLIRRENLLLKQEKLKMEVNMLKKQANS